VGSLQPCVRGSCLALGLLLLVCNQVAGQECPESTTVEAATDGSGQANPVPAAPDAAPRPSALIALYVSYGVTQGLDVFSTRRALERGGREGNPLAGSVGRSTAAMAAIKVASTTGIVLLTEKLWKHNRVAAIVMMVTLNAVNVVVVAHNSSVGR